MPRRMYAVCTRCVLHVTDDIRGKRALIPPPQKPQELLFSLIAQALFQRLARVLDGVTLLQLDAKRLIGARARFGLETFNLGIDPRLRLGLQPGALGGKLLLRKVF